MQPFRILMVAMQPNNTPDWISSTTASRLAFQVSQGCQSHYPCFRAKTRVVRSVSVGTKQVFRVSNILVYDRSRGHLITRVLNREQGYQGVEFSVAVGLPLFSNKKQGSSDPYFLNVPGYPEVLNRKQKKQHVLEHSCISYCIMRD